MPHFIVHCSDSILKKVPTKQILSQVQQSAIESGLFNPKDIKVRLQSFSEYLAGADGDSEFIHVFAHIMQGRTVEQKKQLSNRVVSTLNSMFREVPIVSMNVTDFEKATYCNKIQL